MKYEQLKNGQVVEIQKYERFSLVWKRGTVKEIRGEKYFDYAEGGYATRFLPDFMPAVRLISDVESKPNFADFSKN